MQIHLSEVVGFISFEYIPRNGIADTYGGFIFSFEDHHVFIERFSCVVTGSSVDGCHWFCGVFHLLD